MRYLIKGRNFCINLCGVMNMMVRVQAIHQFIWPMTKSWPKIRNRVVRATDDFNQQKEDAEPKFSKQLLPKLSEHFPSLSEELRLTANFEMLF